ncbi:MAG TPA: sodium ion-translocating decarboxylase subunit beta [Smithellaceae bacterium]|jgi:oxaloacetate decarboxylase beta subunit|nr:sodium ion-translocating decarboxylase subunit beta [Smithellaceae bacterium]HPY34428.1 sodium ion-translocating decarboxylase subunit beta [Smithellaceae bacterium]HQB91797.1 sodium ion-translocating decarboxylase subunit beta [Smithellaceae bacterium]HQM42444.1 sodium ion-translocating decarboxylase subunit beta [Smithellaceae bacterium]
MIVSDILSLFQGIATMISGEPIIAIGRIVLIATGIALVFLGAKGTLEPLIMIPMGLGMASVNAAVLYLSATITGTIFIDPIASDPVNLFDALQINFLQPIYTFTFSNGLIACLLFLGIGVITDVGYIMMAPFKGMLIAIFAELGTILTFPLAVWMGLTYKEAAAISVVGGADGPMVLFTSLILAKDLFVPITIVAYLYLSLTYGGYPYLIRLLVPKRLRGIKMDLKNIPKVSRSEKITFSVITCTVLCLLFPVAAPLFMSFFLGVIIRESGVKRFIEFLEGPVLYGSTFFLGLLLGVLCEAQIILNPKVLNLLILGMFALLMSGIGGIIGGYVLYFITKGNFNPVIGIAGVSCLPTTAKVAQKEVQTINRHSIILPYALGASVSGVITTAIIAAIFVTILR